MLFDELNGIEKMLNKLLKGSKLSVLKNVYVMLFMQVYLIKNIDDSYFKILMVYFDLVKLKVKDKLVQKNWKLLLIVVWKFDVMIWKINL